MNRLAITLTSRAHDLDRNVAPTCHGWRLPRALERSAPPNPVSPGGSDLPMPLQVIGAGFGRTGTASLKAALETLGFGRCYHMFEFMEHPEHAKYWDAASRGKPVAWDELFEGYRATVDWPGCTFYHELMTAYPKANVVLSVRDPERWYESASKTVFTAPRGGLRQLLQLLTTPRMWRSVWVVRRILQVQTFGGKTRDKDHTIAVFQAHNGAVERTVPSERLLVYKIEEGWGPLCRFLGVPVPETPFPHVNDAATFQENIKERFRKGAAKAS